METRGSNINMLTKMSVNTEDFWRENSGGGWVTAFVLLLILAWKLFRSFTRRRSFVSSQDRVSVSTLKPPPPIPHPPNGISKVISDADLRDLIKDLEGKNESEERWEDVIDRKNGHFSYNAKCCRPKDGPTKYLSVTIFESCSPELLRDFYMDNEYRKDWDKTLVEHEQLQVDETSGIEIGRTIKKFSVLMAPREYVLAWRVWEGKDKTFYCLTEDCEHSLAPQQKKYVRVNFYRSGWRIKKVPGRDACEITLVHQEDAGLNVEMAKLAFSKGIWGYICKMSNALQEYSSRRRSQSISVATMLRLIQVVPPVLEADAETSSQSLENIGSSSVIERQDTETVTSERSIWGKPSKQWIANGLLLAGGIVCLSRGRTTLGTQLAMACILKKFVKASDQVEPARIARPRRGRRHMD